MNNFTPKDLAKIFKNEKNLFAYTTVEGDIWKLICFNDLDEQDIIDQVLENNDYIYYVSIIGEVVYLYFHSIMMPSGTIWDSGKMDFR